MQIEEFVSKQAGIQGDNVGLVPKAAVRWKPGKFFYAELGCQDQHHLHVLQYDQFA